jgi:UDP-N-acetylmuramate: L-alanyl-gamma-D-glutamyl-meso-diaminopimelate ligase
MNLIKQADNTLFFEDFAHHPTAVKSVIRSLKNKYPDYRIITVFEPGNASLERKYFQSQLMESLKETDCLLLKDLKKVSKILPEDRMETGFIVNKIKAAGKEAYLCKEYEEIKEYLRNLDLNQKNIVMLMSNGSFGKLPGFITSEY